MNDDKALAPHERRAERLATIRQLGPRQHQIFDLTLEGYSNVGIAERLGISQKTVHTLKGRLATALGWPPEARRKHRRTKESILFDAYLDALWAEHEENGCFVLPGEDSAGVPVLSERGENDYWDGVLTALRIVRCADLGAISETR